MTNTTHKPTILVVDDTPENIDVLRGVLSDSYTLRFAINGELALRLAAAEPQPDLILLDVMMPGMDGHEVCTRLKANPQTQDIPVIFVTTKGETEDEVQGLALGAVDYLTKPVVPAIVLARIQTHLALKQMRQELSQSNATLRHEKEVVEDIVSRIRSTAPFDQTYLRFLLSSVDRTAGDMVLAAFRPDGCQHVLIGDFSGHGLPAAVGGPLVVYIFYQLTAQGQTLATILTEINRTLQCHLPIQLFMATGALEVSADRQHALIWNYGLPPVLILHNGNIVHRICSSGPPLGIIASLDICPSAEDITLQADEYLYIYSDGVTEVPSPTGEEFGQESLEWLLISISQSRLPLEQVWEALIQYHVSADFPDDATLVEIAVST